MFGVVITVPVSGKPVTEFLITPPGTAHLQAIVGGYIEVVPHFSVVRFPEGAFATAPNDAFLGLMKRATESSVPCVVFCNEEGKMEGLPINETATMLWLRSLVELGMITPVNNQVPVHDVLVGDVAILIGDDEFMESL